MRYHMQASKLINRVYLYRNDNFPDYLFGESGEVYSLIRNRFLTGRPSRKDYNQLSLSCNGKQRNVYLHRLIADTFLAPEEGKSQVNHIDGNGLNNSLYNLERVSPSGNMKHAHKIPSRKKNSRGKNLTPEVISEIVRLKGVMSQVEIAKKYNVHRSTVGFHHKRVASI